MTVQELAAKYYPWLWSKARLEALAAAGKLTQAQYEEITGDQAGSVEMEEITGGGRDLTSRISGTPRGEALGDD